ncbi:MAG: SDR family NAD(P)-dependent oxidoreductase [Pseudomonadota bacterium]
MGAELETWTVITGSTGGIGAELARQLAARGDALILLNRSASKARAQREELLAEHPGLTLELVAADLMNLTEIRAAIEKIDELPGRIDALYNVSGLLTANKVLSVQGYESHFAVNTLAPYLLIHGLRHKMARPESDEPAMIVNFSSGAINGVKALDLDNLADPDEVGGLFTTYAQTKLALTALAPALAADLENQNILIRAIDPGATKSPMTTEGNSGMPKLLAWIAPILFAPADKQVAKVVASAQPAAHEGRTGVYIANRKVKPLPAPAADAQQQQRLLEFLDGLLAARSRSTTAGAT